MSISLIVVQNMLSITFLILSLLLHFFYSQKRYNLVPKSQHNNHFNGAGRNVSSQKRPKTEYKMETQIPLK
jgi:hypothetical protein